MPYTIKKEGPHSYAIIKKSTGKVVARAKTRKDAGIYVWKAEGGDKNSWSPASLELAAKYRKPG